MIGIFQNQVGAEEAAQRLHQEGFRAENIDTAWSHADAYARTNSRGVESGDDTPYGVSDESRIDQPGTTRRRDTLNEDRIAERKGRREYDAGTGDSIGRFFRDLFDNRVEAEKFAEAGRGNCIVSVHAASVEEADKAAAILDGCGAIDVNDQAGTGNTYTRAASLDKTDTANTNPRSRIVNKPVEESMRLREERVDNYRTASDRHRADLAGKESNEDNKPLL